MKMIELHLLQSFPFTCLNRNDVGSPKTAFFGGVQRARVSSQCWKRAIREYASTLAPEYFAGKRGHHHPEALYDELVKQGVDQELARKYAFETSEKLYKTDEKKRTTVALYLTPLEISSIANIIKSNLSAPEKINDKLVAKAIKVAERKDFFDVAIFGRMVAADHSLMLEGAGLFSHAFSTHEVTNEVDFFSAVDDTKREESEGAGFIGPLEANSACYYRYIGLNLDLFNDKDHLESVEISDRRTALKVFLHAVLEAVPPARKNSMFGNSLPQYATALVRNGQPLSLVNAFEVPVKAAKEGGYLKPSYDKMNQHYIDLNNTYGIFKGTKKYELKVESSPQNTSTESLFDIWLNKIVDAALEGYK